ncbi:MAG: aa3-type cytochrome c oxidase subunit IV, partial [Pseudomonadota bacterium]
MAKKSESKTPANAMDYPEHENTYDAFIKLSIWTTVFCVARLVAMAFGFFGGGGLIG